MGQLHLFATPQQGETSDDRWTPPWVFEQLGLTFDIDVCAPPGGIPWIPAARYYTQAEDGLAQPWYGRVWCNPPYSDPTPWIDRFVEHGHGIAFVQISRSKWCNRLWDSDATLVLAPSNFKFVQGGIFMPVWWAAFGDECRAAVSTLGKAR